MEMLKRTTSNASWVKPASMAVAAALCLGAASVLLADEGYQGQGFSAMEQLDSDVMEEMRAREGVAIFNLTNVESHQNMNSSVINPVFDVDGDMVSGHINFEKGAIDYFSGTGIITAITGNANSVNNAIGISIYVAP